MQTTLIIIRGNSGSGKTTLAQALQRRLGANTLLVSQDVVRREMLMSNDHPGNLAIELIHQIARYGNGRVPFVIVEGILARDRYASMLAQLQREFERTLTYYFDVDFATTLARHQTRQRDFGPDEMRRWWLPHDVLGWPDERLLPSDAPLTTEVDTVLNTLNVD
ncbi:kinase [Lactiplantibacillus carotarum]|uniref:kinase n=1 Tax=Lactiplantibacillus carotarum TaxID=2993456 RepID=UPI00298F3BF2|nr:kinase [Lactiplantibacillus carotarum]